MEVRATCWLSSWSQLASFTFVHITQQQRGEENKISTFSGKIGLSISVVSISALVSDGCMLPPAAPPSTLRHTLRGVAVVSVAMAVIVIVIVIALVFGGDGGDNSSSNNVSPTNGISIHSNKLADQN